MSSSSFFFIFGINKAQTFLVRDAFIIPVSFVLSHFTGFKACFVYLVCKNKIFSTNFFLYKLLWHKQQICCFKKIYKYPFLLYKYLQYPLAHFIILTVQSLPQPSLTAPSPPDLNHTVFTCLRWRQSEEEGPSSGGVRAGRGRWRVEVMRVAPLRVRGRRAAFIVLLCRQVLASRCGRWGHRF